MKEPLISRQGTGGYVHQNGDLPLCRRKRELVRSPLNQLLRGETLAPLHLLQIGQLQQTAHHSGEVIHLPLHDLKKVLHSCGGKVPLFAEQADPGFQDRQRRAELVGRVVGEVFLHDKDLVQPPGHLVEGAGQLGHLVPAVRDGQGPLQILRRAPPDLSGQLVQRGQRLSNQPVDEVQAGGQYRGHSQQALEVEDPPGLLDSLIDLQGRHRKIRVGICLSRLGRQEGHGLDAVGHLDGRQVVGQGKQEAAEGEQGRAQQGEPQAQGHGLFHRVSSPARRYPWPTLVWIGS